ncbi:class I SAM-dependent DNA methyltransferase [Rickettsia felis]|uniref:HsdM family class I SAM-dependent methyltransferase n=1 Tax=Rickettsia felis TaxID=42862 RepID=UPI001585530C|nr:N-6 DNA methylase [Rickettsia felis]
MNTIVAKLDDLHLSATHSDIKGDAFEYFLRNYGGADTDFGEYFTPRHIVTALVNLLDPKFGEKVYDPFCGTGGMLITSYKHIYDNLSLRTPENIQRLKKQTVYGGEITKMYRIAKMNMILAGDGHSNIVRQNSYGTPDTIKQIDVIKDGFVTKENIKIKYDVVISNMPFGRKMKTEHAGLYGFNTRSAEITGVLHCLNSLNNNENARLGLIVPEGILFDKRELISIRSISLSDALISSSSPVNLYICLVILLILSLILCVLPLSPITAILLSASSSILIAATPRMILLLFLIISSSINFLVLDNAVNLTSKHYNINWICY